MKKVYRVGYVGLLDDAPLHVALSQGLFGDEGFSVELSCELGWAALSAKLATGTLAAANVSALHPLLPSIAHQPTHTHLEVITATSFAGLSVTLANEFTTLLKSKEPLPAPLRIGVAVPRGDAHVVLAAWQKSIGLAPSEVVLVPLAVSQFVDALAESYVHGFVASDPITTQAQRLGRGVMVARSHDYFPYHPRSVTAVRAHLAIHDPEFCKALKFALRKARAFCARPENWPVVQEILNRESRGGRGLAPENATTEAFGRSFPSNAFFEKETSSRQELDQGGIDFLRRACFATDPAFRDQDVRAAINKVYRESLEILPNTPELRAVYL